MATKTKKTLSPGRRGALSKAKTVAKKTSKQGGQTGTTADQRHKQGYQTPPMDRVAGMGATRRLRTRDPTAWLTLAWSGIGPVAHTLTWVMPPYVLYGVKYIDLVSLGVEWYWASQTQLYQIKMARNLDSRCVLAPAPWVTLGDLGSRYLGCWGQNTSRIQHKEVETPSTYDSFFPGHHCGRRVHHDHGAARLVPVQVRSSGANAPFTMPTPCCYGPITMPLPC